MNEQVAQTQGEDIPVLSKERVETHILPYDSKDLKLIKEVSIKHVVDAQRLLTDDGEIIYLEGLYIPKSHDIDLISKAYLEKYFINKVVTVYGCKKTDCKQFDRLGHRRAHIVTKAEKIWLQSSLVNAGLALVRTRYDWPYMADAMRIYEQAAREHAVGLWAHDDYKTLSAAEIKDKTRGYRIVDGTVRSVALKGNKIYLNFGENWRKDFTIVIPSSLRRQFSKANINIMEAQGKDIKVRGWVDAYNGPYIEIDHIEQIEWVEPQAEGDAAVNSTEAINDSVEKKRPAQKTSFETND